MKKVGILNFQYSTHNYGAVLQAAALEHICTQLGHEAQHLDYMAKRRVTFKGRVGQALRQLGLRKTPGHNRVVNEQAFERFRERFLTRSKKITAQNEFSSIASKCDTVIVGSDQVWRPAFAKDTLGFFLGYVPDGVDRVSYAASFGTASWEKCGDATLTDQVGKELKKFKAVSCREESGVEICKDVFGVEAEHVLDPLLLVDDNFFNLVISSSEESLSENIVYYKLDSSPEFQRDLLKVASEGGDLPVNIYLKDSNKAEYREVADWLGLIRNAEVVVTDSFHCICLSLRFGKEVIFCPNEHRGQARLDSLFKQLGISVEPLDIDLQTPMFKLSRSGRFDEALAEERKSALTFLTGALDG